jgi:hypothetical protein
LNSTKKKSVFVSLVIIRLNNTSFVFIITHTEKYEKYAPCNFAENYDE